MQKKTNYSCDILLAKQKKTIEKIRDLLLESDENDTKTLEELQEKEAGRNDPCPCGSGKKYKRCHGA